MTKNIHIHTVIDENLYNKIKSCGYKINLLIARGYECITGKCITSEVLKNELDECKKKLSDLESKNRSDTENLIKKFVDENSELKVIKLYLNLLLNHLINKYVKSKEQLEKELNEVFGEEKKQKFLRLVKERKIFIHYL